MCTERVRGVQRECSFCGRIVRTPAAFVVHNSSLGLIFIFLQIIQRIYRGPAPMPFVMRDRPSSSQHGDIGKLRPKGGRGPSKRLVFADMTLVVDFGVVLDALTAAGLAAKFSPGWRIPARSLIGGDWRAAARLWRAPHLRLQQRRPLQRHRLRQFTGLAVARGCIRRQRLWDQASPAVRSLGKAKPIIAAGP